MGAYVFKEKLKLLKKDIKVWNSEVFGDIGVKREAFIQDIAISYVKDEQGTLVVAEVVQCNKLFAEFWSMSKNYESLMLHKSRLNWLQDSDENTRLFHTIVN